MGCSSCGRRYTGNALDRQRAKAAKPPPPSSANSQGPNHQGVTPAPVLIKEGESKQ